MNDVVTEPPQGAERFISGIDLYWIPLGAGGNGYVRLNGRVYEAIKARLEGRRSFDLYHTALEVRVPEGRFIIENVWPSPDADTRSRGVVMEGPVFNRRLARFRPFRYEVRCWRDGVIPDAGAGGRKSATLERRPTPCTASSQIGGIGAGRDLGTRRVGYRRHVELQLGDRMAGHSKRSTR